MNTMVLSKTYLKVILVLFLSLFVLAACAPTLEIQQREYALAKEKSALDAKQKMLDEKAATLAAQERQMGTAASGSQTRMMGSKQQAQSSTMAGKPVGIDAPLLPPNAKPGECYARVFVPPTYETTTETLLKKAVSEKIEIIPATYKMVEKKVLVGEASEKIITIPAEYGYKSKDVLVREKQQIWKTSLSKSSAEASQALLKTAEKHGINLAAAKPGDCFHEHYVQPVYETLVEDELVAEESYRIEVVPAKYGMVEKEVLVSEATQRLKTVPTTYKWVEEKILVKEAQVKWKKGTGLIQKIDNTTGEIMCLVEEPAVYKTVKKRVVDQTARTVTENIPAVYKKVKVRTLIAAATQKKIPIPAKYKKVKRQKLATQARVVWHEVHNMELTKQSRTGNKICLVEIPSKYRKATKKVVVTPAKTVIEKLPAKYKMVKVKTVATKAYERKIIIPAEYQKVTKTSLVTDGALEWREVLCETNTTKHVVSKIQSALIAKGYDPGPVDGVYGRKTTAAINKYQTDKGFATGGLTLETLESLGL
jgi:hypothetical protein